MLKLGNDVGVMMAVAAGRRRLHIKAVCQSVREAALPPPAWIMRFPPTGRTPLNGLFHPQRG